MTKTINITATAHYNKNKSTIIRAQVVKETGDQVYFRASKKAVAAAEKRAGLMQGDYFDFSHGKNNGFMAAIDYDGNLVGDMSK